MHSGLIDMHSHILANLDDGANTLADSIALAKYSVEQGICTVVATPHYSKGYKVTRFNRNIAAARLKKELAKKNISLEILLGFEVHATKTFLNFSQPKKLTINNSKYILVEHGKDVQDWEIFLNIIENNKLVPIIAHPERFAHFRNDVTKLEQLASKGAILQLNTASIIGENGKRAQDFCQQLLLKENLKIIISTDSHCIFSRAPKMQSAINILESWAGETKTKTILYDNPALILGRKTNN